MLLVLLIPCRIMCLLYNITIKINHMKKKSVKKEDKNIKLLSKDQEVLIKGPSHCELCKVIDVNKNSALLSNGISVNPKYDRKIKSLTP